MSTSSPIITFPRYTRRHVSKPDSGHRHEAEIESIKEAPVLPDNEHGGSEDVEEYHGR